jgi:hypothetical protein
MECILFKRGLQALLPFALIYLMTGKQPKCYKLSYKKLMAPICLTRPPAGIVQSCSFKYVRPRAKSDK